MCWVLVFMPLLVVAEAMVTIAKVAVVVLVKTLVLEVVTPVTVNTVTMAEVMLVLEVVVGTGCGGENGAAVLGSDGGRDGRHGAVGSGRGWLSLLIPMLPRI